MKRTATLFLIANIAYTGAAAAQTDTSIAPTPDNVALCRTATVPETLIPACSAVIEQQKLNPTGLATAYANRGIAYMNKNQIDNAFRDFDAAIHLNPSDAGALFAHGYIYFTRKDYDKAIPDFDSAIQLAPNDPMVYLTYFYRAQAYGIKREDEKAIADYSKIIGLKPDFVNAFQNRGTIYASHNQYDKAILDYNAALKIAPDDVHAHLMRAAAYSAIHQFGNAVADYDAVVRAKPDMAEAYYYRSIVKKNAGDKTGGDIDLTRAKQLGYTESKQ